MRECLESDLILITSSKLLDKYENELLSQGQTESGQLKDER